MEALPHYCRGCGLILPPRFRGHFHKRCLREDKRQRVRQRRLREQRKLQKRLERLICPQCGATYQEGAAHQEDLCEASQGPWGRKESGPWGIRQEKP